MSYNIELPIRGQLEKEQDFHDRTKANENLLNQNFKKMEAEIEILKERLKALGG